MPRAKKPKLQERLSQLQLREPKQRQSSSQPKAKSVKQKAKNYQSFSPDDKILLLGEECQGNNVIATSLDTEAIAKEKYQGIEANLATLQEFGATTLFEIDARKLASYKRLRTKKFDLIIFNFPHGGTGIKDQDRNVEFHRKLLREFFISAESLLSERGEIHVTLKAGLPYDLWELKSQGKAAGLSCKRSTTFDPQWYPGYEHRRTIGFTDGISKSENAEIKAARLYMFMRKPDVIGAKRMIV